MKTEVVLRTLQAIYPAIVGDVEQREMQDLINACKQELEIKALSCTDKTRTTAIKKILKGSVRPDLQGAIHYNGKQYFTNGYCLIEVANPLPIPEHPDELSRKQAVELVKNVLPTMNKAKESANTEVKLPPIHALREKVKQLKKDKALTTSPLRLGESDVYCDPYYLDLMVSAIGANCFYVSKGIEPIWFESETARGFLLPVRNNTNSCGITYADLD